jgi:hypothetical protein
MTNGRGRFRALVVAHHRKSRAERVIGVEPRLATRLAPHGRVEGAIEDGPGPISGWGDQNPKGQPQAHSRSALVAPMLANPSTPLRSGARSCSFATTPSRCKARRNETFPESIMEAPAAAASALGARERIAWTNAPDCSWRRSASPGVRCPRPTARSTRSAPGSTPGPASGARRHRHGAPGLRSSTDPVRRERDARREEVGSPSRSTSPITRQGSNKKGNAFSLLVEEPPRVVGEFRSHG